MQNLYSPPPSSIARGDNALGPQAGVQAKQVWTNTERDSRPIASMMRAPNLWRLCVYGENVLVELSWGTSAQKKLTGLQTPIRITVPGSLDVYAQPVLGQDEAASCQVSITPVSSGTSDSDCRKLVTDAGSFEVDASRFVALEASVVRVGPLSNSIVVTLAALQSVSLVAGSALTSGGGYLEFEP